MDPRTIEAGEAYVQAFEAVDADGHNEMVVLDEGDGTVLGYLQLTYIPGLGRHGQERALIEGVRVRAYRRGAGLGRELLTWAIDRARAGGCTLVQLTSNKRRTTPTVSTARSACSEPRRIQAAAVTSRQSRAEKRAARGLRV